ncbi:MAG TPA: hypothetical protein QGH10_20645, partial [Armatimonadota bacterium]|nr:hypothetical protein [Armatimonadota bacterium]
MRINHLAAIAAVIAALTCGTVAAQAAPTAAEQAVADAFSKWCVADLPFAKKPSVSEAAPWALCEFGQGGSSSVQIRAEPDETKRNGIVTEGGRAPTTVNGQTASESQTSNTAGFTNAVLKWSRGPWVGQILLSRKTAGTPETKAEMAKQARGIAQDVDDVIAAAMGVAVDEQWPVAVSLIILIDRRDCIADVDAFSSMGILDTARLIRSHDDSRLRGRDPGETKPEDGVTEVAMMTFDGGAVHLEHDFSQDPQDTYHALGSLYGASGNVLDLIRPTGSEKRDLAWAATQALIHACRHGRGVRPKISLVSCSHGLATPETRARINTLNRALRRVAEKIDLRRSGSLWTLPWAVMGQSERREIGGPDETLEDALATLEGLAPQLTTPPVVDVVGIGFDPGSEAAQTLKELAAAGGGTYATAPTAADVGAALARIASGEANPPDLQNGHPDTQPGIGIVATSAGTQPKSAAYGKAKISLIVWMANGLMR